MWSYEKSMGKTVEVAQRLVKVAQLLSEIP